MAVATAPPRRPVEPPETAFIIPRKAAQTDDLGKEPVSDGIEHEPDDFAPKIVNGTGDRLSPVVGIANNQKNCTGTFIARNFILTAAHCLETAPGFVPTTLANEPNAKYISGTNTAQRDRF